MSFRDKLAQRIQENNLISTDTDIAGDTKDNVEAFDKSPFYGAENIRNQPSCVDFRLSNGKSVALPYAYFVEISFSPSDGIEIVSTTKKVCITGRNLKNLYHYLVSYRIKFVQANIGNDLSEDKALFVKDISVVEI